MKRILLIIALLFSVATAQTRYSWPLSVESSSGRPLNAQTVAIFDTTGTLYKNLVYETGSPGRYYSTTAIANGVYTLKLYSGGVWRTVPGHERINIEIYGLDQLRAIVGDSVAALSADGVTIVNNSGTFRIPVYENITAIGGVSGDSVGSRIILKQLSASNTSGGGVLLYQTSGWTVDNISVFAASSGYWVREERYNYPNRWEARWLGDNSLSSGQVVNNLLKANTSPGDIIILDEGQYTGGFSFNATTEGVTDSITLQGQGMFKTFVPSFTMQPYKSMRITDMTIGSGIGSDVVLGGAEDSTVTIEFENIRTIGASGGAHNFQVGFYGECIFNNIWIYAGGAAHGLAIRGGTLKVSNIYVENAGSGITIKSADSDPKTYNCVVTNYRYKGTGSAVLLESNDSRVVQGVAITNVTVDSGATRVLWSNTYDAGLATYNGIIKDVVVSNITAPFLTNNAFVLDGVENILFSNINIDSTAGYGFFTSDGTGRLKWAASNIHIRATASGIVNGYTGSFYTNINGEQRQQGRYIMSADGVHPNEEYSNGIAESFVADLTPLDSAAGSWRPGFEVRQPAVEANKSSQNIRLLTGGYRTTTGGTYFGTGIRNALVANNNANNPNNLWEQFSFNTYYHWGIGVDTTEYILYTDSNNKNIGIGNRTGLLKQQTKLMMYDTNPRMIMTDADVNQNVSSVAQAADTQAVYIWAHGSTPSVQLTDANGNDLVIQPVVSASANAGGGASVPATVSGFLVFTWNGTTYKIPYFAN